MICICPANRSVIFYQQGDDGADQVDISEGNYGTYPLMQSKEKNDRQLVRVGELDPSKADQEVWVRGRMHTSRAKGDFQSLTDVMV